MLIGVVMFVLIDRIDFGGVMAMTRRAPSLAVTRRTMSLLGIPGAPLLLLLQ